MEKTKVKVGVDIGGTHISAALVDMEGNMLDGAYVHISVDAMEEATIVLDTWAKAISAVVALAGEAEVSSIGIAMPGPFDYEQGISLIKDMAKYEQLYGINIREALLDRVYPLQIPITFHNDAVCFGHGTVAGNATLHSAKVLTITLGTGLGACYLDKGVVCLESAGVPPHGFLYDYPFLNGRAEDYISARWLLKEYAALGGEAVPDVKTLAELASSAEPGQEGSNTSGALAQAV